MRLRGLLTAAAAAVLLAGGGLLAGGASAATGGPARMGGPATDSRPAAVSPSGVQLPGVVSPSPAKWTPNVFAGSPACNPQWFGPGGQCTDATVWSTAVVNGEVVVVGAFTQACPPGPASSGHCAPGTLVTRDDIFAYQLATGTIDPNFAPQLDQGPVLAAVAGPGNTVYVAGNFTTVNGVPEPGVVQLSVAPGGPSDGQVVPGFAAQITGRVNALAFAGNALYAGGQFDSLKSFGGTKDHAIVRLNATTGAVDPAFKFTLGGSVSGTVQVEHMALAPDAGTLAIAGAFLTVDGQSIPRVAVIGTGGGYGAPAALDNWSAPVLANPCSHQHDYVRGIDFSPDGSYFVVADTGYQGSGGGPNICDAAARFATGATGSVQPAWINYTGGDSLYSVAVTGSAVYVGGHNRWSNNECGNNRVCEANAVLTNGIAALDPHTGLALPWWHPETLRGAGVVSLQPFPAGSYTGSKGGLLLGTDVNSIGGTYHSMNALFPLKSAQPGPAGGPILSGMFSLGRLGGSNESTAGVADMCVDDAGNGSAPGTPVELSTCTNAGEQNWTIEPDGTIGINGMCLDTASGGTAPGTAAVLGTCGGSGTQVWTQGSGDTLVNQAANLCLDDPDGSTSNGTELQISACDGSAHQSWPLPAAPAPPPPPPTGAVYPSELQKSTQVPCLFNASNAAVAGAKAELWVCEGLVAEQWTMESDGTFRNYGLCLDTNGGGTGAGTPAVLNTCNGSATQTWAPGPNGSLVNDASGLCLDDPASNTKNGTQLQIWVCNGGSNQHWWLPAV